MTDIEKELGKRIREIGHLKDEIRELNKFWGDALMKAEDLEIKNLAADKTILQLKFELAEKDSLIKNLTEELDETKAELGAVLNWLETEINWEFFRAEFNLNSQSESNARQLQIFLNQTNRGKLALEELKNLKKQAKG
jgi:chromosome segregation ATPase